MFKAIKFDDGYYYRPISRWCKVQTLYITKRHSLAEWADSDNSVFCFRALGKWYALGQFLRFGGPCASPCPPMYEDKEGKWYYLSGFEAENYVNPYYIEFNDTNEYIRLWECLGK